MSWGAGVKAVATPEHTGDASYSLSTNGVWYVPGGAITGSEAAPTNLASVPANRRIRCSARRGAVVIMGVMTLKAFTFDGTSLVIRAWFYDDTQAIWIPHGAAVTCTTAAVNAQSISVGNMAGALFYLQISGANTGGVTALGYDFV